MSQRDSNEPPSPPSPAGAPAATPAPAKRSVLDAVSRTADYNDFLARGPALPFAGPPLGNAPVPPVAPPVPFGPPPSAPPLAPSPAVEPARAVGMTVGQSAAVTTPPKPAPAAAAVAPAVVPREIVELVYYGAGAPARLRQTPALAELLKGAVAPAADEELFDELPPGRRPSAKDRHDVLTVLTRAPSIGPDGAASMALQAANEWGAFTPPLAVFSGELELPFDDVEALRATVAVVTPLAGTDKKLADTIDLVHETFKQAWAPSAPAVIEWLSSQMKEAIAPVKQRLGARYVESAVERMLLGQRHYQRRLLLGQPRIRGLLSAQGSSTVLPAYLSDSIARELPALSRFRVKMIAEIRPQMDQGDAGPWALRVLALARVVGR